MMQLRPQPRYCGCGRASSDERSLKSRQVASTYISSQLSINDGTTKFGIEDI
ncbi:hypothetical protein Lalb_Chr19g0128071 [Lupinus albus]|uniref:Uncharacterized protein n=1 Tax=Lupinus albus TaxID=3870 RepID=A0A6A4NY97_LUPAL|nr:hypothetical protein Lalb_Chr19g0128071 [Lupinus albus]